MICFSSQYELESFPKLLVEHSRGNKSAQQAQSGTVADCSDAIHSHFTLPRRGDKARQSQLARCGRFQPSIG